MLPTLLSALDTGFRSRPTLRPPYPIVRTHVMLGVSVDSGDHFHIQEWIDFTTETDRNDFANKSPMAIGYPEPSNRTRSEPGWESLPTPIYPSTA